MTESSRRIAAAGCLLAAIGIAGGAFGAHGLRRVLDAQQLELWHTGFQYLTWNAVGLVALAALPRRLGLAAMLIGAGTLIFAGSLCAMALTGERWLGMVTPAGGIAMIAGWLVAGWRVARS